MTTIIRERQRFARIFQFTSIPWLRGTPQLRQAVREALAFPFNSPADRLLYRLDVAVNRSGRHYLTVEFHKNMLTPGLAGFAGMSLSAAEGQGPGLGQTARHEAMGHLSDFYLIDDSVRSWFTTSNGFATWQPLAWEWWAEAVRQWCESDGQVWSSLTPILLGEAA